MCMGRNVAVEVVVRSLRHDAGSVQPKRGTELKDPENDDAKLDAWTAVPVYCPPLDAAVEQRLETDPGVAAAVCLRDTFGLKFGVLADLLGLDACHPHWPPVLTFSLAFALRCGRGRGKGSCHEKLGLHSGVASGCQHSSSSRLVGVAIIHRG